MKNKLTAEMLNGVLNNGCTAFVYDEVDSTNKIIKQLGLQQAPEGTLAVAQRQTAGRGRLGRSFFSPDGGIYFSLLLRPDISAGNSVYITVAAAVAAARAIERASGKECRIKWVNDIYIDGKKVCGILTEGVFCQNGERPDSVVLGIGINLTSPQDGYPADIADRAAAVFGSNGVSAEQKAAIVGNTVNEFMALYKELGNLGFIEEYRRRSYLDGLIVSFEENGRQCVARVKGIDEKARLVLEKEGETVILHAGDVSVRPVSEGNNG